MPTYRAGTVTLTNGSKTVTGSGTKWSDAINGVSAGMMFIGPDGKVNIIASVASNTSLTLEDNYTGTTGAGQAYKIVTTYEGDISQFSAPFTALLARFEGNSDVLYAWLTSTAATMTWTKADGTSETIATLSAVTATTPVNRGGTGATTASDARANLGLSNAILSRSGLADKNRVLSLAGSETSIGVSRSYVDLKPFSNVSYSSETYRLLAILPPTSSSGNRAIISITGTVGGFLDSQGKALFHLLISTRNAFRAVGSINGRLVNQDIRVYLINSLYYVYAVTNSYTTDCVLSISGSIDENASNPDAITAFRYHTSSETSETPQGELVYSLKNGRFLNVDYDGVKVSGSVFSFNGKGFSADTNGFWKSASPILRLANSPAGMPDNWLNEFEVAGCGAVNNEAVGVAAERKEVGVYLITGSLGLATEGWTIEIPQDVNGNRLCFVETETSENGDITVRVSRRKLDIETGNIVAGVAMNIPSGRWIDLRLSMPVVEETETAEVVVEESTTQVESKSQ